MSAYKRDDKEFKAKLAQLADKKSLKVAQLVTKKTVRLPEKEAQAFRPAQLKCVWRGYHLYNETITHDDGCIDCGLPPYPSIFTTVSNFIRRIFNV
jgi:hypothetical protein